MLESQGGESCEIGKEGGEAKEMHLISGGRPGHSVRKLGQPSSRKVANEVRARGGRRGGRLLERNL
jgi:hypothetical protein